jgi:hypothetical protein
MLEPHEDYSERYSFPLTHGNVVTLCFEVNPIMEDYEVLKKYIDLSMKEAPMSRLEEKEVE